MIYLDPENFQPEQPAFGIPAVCFTEEHPDYRLSTLVIIICDPHIHIGNLLIQLTGTKFKIEYLSRLRECREPAERISSCCVMQQKCLNGSSAFPVAVDWRDLNLGAALCAFVSTTVKKQLGMCISTVLLTCLRIPSGVTCKFSSSYRACFQWKCRAGCPSCCFREKSAWDVWWDAPPQYRPHLSVIQAVLKKASVCRAYA